MLYAPIRLLHIVIACTVGLSNLGCSSPCSEVPHNGFCAPYAGCPEATASAEQAGLIALNNFRASGADCGINGFFEAAPSVTMSPALRCAARAHTQEMAATGEVTHSSQNGDLPSDRMQKAGCTPRVWAENIASGYESATDVLEAWRNSPDHCRNMLLESFEQMGIAGHEGYWTLVLASGC